MSARSIRVSPAPDLPKWADKAAGYASPDDMDEEIGSNGSIAGLFVEDDEKVGFSAQFYRASLEGLSWVARNEPESSAMVFQQAVLLGRTMPPNGKTYMPFSEAQMLYLVTLLLS